ncbi:TspO/MBR family protein [Amycolatopsis pithecellobii]|uniref:Tryptophan-rich sensory protein n=1 Tax=Amycolatopsis pithecellobii TaxID=664692 RepID=A0A6N7ZAS8_9PSEU|nr:TspO/MBR family protein [Amycolatopsis pithecellobii]MTD58837.1 tryptophan-rich sensory protein [Amycolatopsis pithecellobii]
MQRSASGLVFAAGSALVAATLGSLASTQAPDVYKRLDKPRWAPPAGVFGPVWTALYTVIGVAGWRLWTGQAGRAALGLHTGQLALNAAWPTAFFAARNRTLSLAVIAALDGAIAAEIVAARRDPITAGLLTPYLAWSLFATALTVGVSDPATASPRGTRWRHRRPRRK